MQTLSTLVAAVAALAATTTAQVITSGTPTKPEMSPPFNGAQQEIDLINDLPSHTNTHDAWSAGFVPRACYNEALSNDLNPADFEVWNVHYSDCSGSPWAICRHKQATESWDFIITTIGKMPVGMRQYLSNIIMLPGPAKSGACAYTWTVSWGSFTTFSKGCLTLGVASHEFSHVMDTVALKDVVVANGYPSGTAYSSTANFFGAYKKDSSVPTDYSHTDWAEDFADTGRVAMSDMTHAGGLASNRYTTGWAQISNQIGNYEGRLKSIIFPSGGKCTGKVDSTQAVSVTTGMKVKARDLDMIVGRASSNETDVPEIKNPEGLNRLFVYPYNHA